MPHGLTIATPEQTEMMQQLVAEGKKANEIADAIGISRPLFFRLTYGDRDPEFAEAYHVAKKAYVVGMMDSLDALAREPLHASPKFANAAVARQRLIIDTWKWIGSRLLPRVYGDTLNVDHRHSGEVKVSPLAQLRQLEGGDGARQVQGREITNSGDSVTEDDCF